MADWERIWLENIQRNDEKNLDPTLVRRLSFIKYLYAVATERSEQPQPMNAAAVLTFHDSIELFLHLACEKSNIETTNTDFKGYWTKLNPIYSQEGLSQHASMMRLNKARVGLKHSGILPSSLEIEGFRAATTNFFEENTPKVFGIAFSDISMADLLQSQEARMHLRKADAMMDEGNIETAFSELARAFFEVENFYEESQRDEFGRSPYGFGKSLLKVDELKRTFGVTLSEICETVNRLCEAMRVLALGLDYRKFVRFSELTPRVLRPIGGGPVVHDLKRTPPPTLNDYQFCRDFVIECAIVLQGS